MKYNAVLPFAVLWIPLSSCHCCPFVFPPIIFPVCAHVVLLVIHKTDEKNWKINEKGNEEQQPNITRDKPSMHRRKHYHHVCVDGAIDVLGCDIDINMMALVMLPSIASTIKIYMKIINYHSRICGCVVPNIDISAITSASSTNDVVNIAKYMNPINIDNPMCQ
jgi:hypothetical protein